MMAIVLPLALLTMAPPAGAGIHQVWDEGHFFKNQTIGQADAVLDDVVARFGKDLMVETFASIPDDFKAKYEEEGKEKFFEGWSIAEGRRLGVNGVLILITGDPAHLKVQVGLATRRKAFTESDANELAEQLAAAFRKKDFDAGIRDAVQFVRARMAKNGARASAPNTRPETQPAQPPQTHAAADSSTPPAAAGSPAFGK